MKLKKIIALSSAFVLLAGTGLTIGLTIGLDEKTPPIVESGLTGSTGAKMAWSDLVTNKVVNVEEGELNVNNEEVEKLCPNDTTFTLEIPEDAGVTKIGFDAFNECMKLTSISIPSTVIEIDTDAFYNCDNLTTVSFANNSKLTTIGYGAFTYCEKLVNIQIPSSVTRIDQSAFIGCSNLEAITIPSGVTTIESHVFKDCVKLSSITLNGTVTKIEPYAFYNCSGLTSIDNIIKDAIVIQNSAFARCDKLESVQFGSALNEIEFDAFMDCQGLKTVSFGSDYVTFGLGVFRNCINLVDITLPVNTTSISDYMFYNCEDLTSFTVGTNVTYIGYRAFMNCFKLNLTFEEVNWLYSNSKDLSNLTEIVLNSDNANKIIDELADCYFTMKCNEVVISSLDKVYDSNPVNYPTITTRDGYDGLADPNTTDIEVIWSYYDSEGTLHSMENNERPVNAGKYNVKVIYPETENYLEIEVSKDFVISPIELTIISDSSDIFTDSIVLFEDENGNSVELESNTDYQILYFMQNENDIYDNEKDAIEKPTTGTFVMRVILIGTSANNYSFENGIYQDFLYSIVDSSGPETEEEGEL